ncbi:MAG: hypothetical protein M1321_01120, partial [Candidatus Marsarchaeota archaeon]|nr:hypothetical protein [Candidatus Marsarchaeota archaeon]
AAILNNCVYFVSEVKRISCKANLTRDEEEIKKKAAIVAALSSTHSWHTFKYLHNYGEMDFDAMIEETAFAFKEGWKNISENDVEEVVNSNQAPYMFSMWMFYALDEKQRSEFSQLFGKLKKEQEYGLEPIERKM